MIKVIYSDYYSEITENILTSIRKRYSVVSSLHDKKINIDSYKVSGVWEIPYKINKLSVDFKYFIAVGVIVKGKTDHYEYLSTAVVNALMNLTIYKDIYIANCVLNVQDISQAIERAESKGIEALDATINTISNE